MTEIIIYALLNVPQWIYILDSVAKNQLVILYIDKLGGKYIWWIYFWQLPLENIKCYHRNDPRFLINEQVLKHKLVHLLTMCNCLHKLWMVNINCLNIFSIHFMYIHYIYKNSGLFFVSLSLLSLLHTQTENSMLNKMVLNLSKYKNCLLI